MVGLVGLVWLVGCLVGLVGCYGWLVGLVVSIGWLGGWFWFVGWLVGWLVGLDIFLLICLTISFKPDQWYVSLWIIWSERWASKVRYLAV